MLLKLLKYDLRSMWKQFSLIWGAALALALVTRFTSSFRFRLHARDFQGNIPGFFSAVLLVVLTVMFVIAAVFVIRRFYKGLLGDEGYLMHTLPVRAWQLVLSKLTCAAVTVAGNLAVAVLAVLIMVPTDWSELLDLTLWSDVFRGVINHPDIVPLMLEFCLVLLAAGIQAVAVLYLAMSIGHLFSRRRGLASVAAYIGLHVLMVDVLGRVFSWDPLQLLIDAATENVHTSMLAAAAAMLIPAALFLAAVCWILDNRLNLE